MESGTKVFTGAVLLSCCCSIRSWARSSPGVWLKEGDHTQTITHCKALSFSPKSGWCSWALGLLLTLVQNHIHGIPAVFGQRPEQNGWTCICTIIQNDMYYASTWINQHAVVLQPSWHPTFAQEPLKHFEPSTLQVDNLFAAAPLEWHNPGSSEGAWSSWSLYVIIEIRLWW